MDIMDLGQEYETRSAEPVVLASFGLGHDWNRAIDYAPLFLFAIVCVLMCYGMRRAVEG